MSGMKAGCLALLSGALLMGCADTAPAPAPVAAFDGRELVERVYAAAGGDLWVRPRSLYMRGSTTFYRVDAQGVEIPVATNDSHRMWRVYPQRKSSAHTADGKVRIRSEREGAVVFDVAFDGARTHQWDADTGAVVTTPEPADSTRWSANFGFGVIRHALDPGYTVERLPDAVHQGRSVPYIDVIDPAGGRTRFAIDPEAFMLLSVAFATPRGWHERHYSAFFRKAGSNWLQPGEVHLYYDGKLQNRVRWEDYAVNADWPDALFAMEALP
ncbi:MAG: hypothetical protein AAGI15_16225 [Pseudomonadota bacterium]